MNIESRAAALKDMQGEVFDLVIIGGGITGAGVARDACSRGMRVALIEARDFAFGTSSRSSKLIHGGIRYLENLEFHLVFEALSERQILFEIAPHLVHPLRFILPIYKGGRVPAWKMGIGMWIYDALSLFEAPELNEYFSADELQRDFPALQTDQLTGGFAYSDAYMDDDRLVLETLRSAHRLGAVMANYVKATGAQFTDGKVSAVECVDALTGAPFRVAGRHVISTVGPWTDRLGENLFKQWKKTLRPSKGVHLTFKQSRLPLHDAVVMGAENRIVFAIPRHEMVIVGTTDTDYPGDPGEVRTEPEDVDYLLRVIEKYFPGAQIGRADIVGCYAGVRPLIYDGSESESKTSREHAIWTDPRGVTFVAGGKYTTYRNMATQTVEHALHGFPTEDHVRFGRAQTKAPLNPLITDMQWKRSIGLADEMAARWGVAEAITRALTFRHGFEAEKILEQSYGLISHASSSEEQLWCMEAIHAMEHTMCLTLVDFFFRRTPLVLAREDHGAPFAATVGRVMAQRLGWSDRRLNDEINAMQNHLAWELEATIQG